MKTAPENRAPIMPALALEVVPAARHKGCDRELAQLLEDAIPVYDATVVDGSTQAGKNFLYAKPFHIERARWLIGRLRG
jgi:hypothetical protein